MKLWLDDERPAPEGFLRFYSSAEMIRFLERVRHYDVVLGVQSNFEEFSLDHDLGGDDTAKPVLAWMTRNSVWPRVVTVHTSNPPARDEMLRAINADAPPEVDIYVIYR